MIYIVDIESGTYFPASNAQIVDDTVINYCGVEDEFFGESDTARIETAIKYGGSTVDELITYYDSYLTRK